MSDNVMTETVNETVAETVMERPYTLRRLKDCDLWPVLDIIAKVFPDDLASSFAEFASGQKDFGEIGVGLFTRLLKAVIKNLPVVKDEVYAFLSDVSGIPAAEIAEMEFGTTPLMIWDIVTNEKNAGFFTVVSKLS